MKVVLPLAGLGTRLRPHTYSKPKPLVDVAGNTVLGHILEAVAELPVDEVVFITGYLGGQVKDYVRSRYAFPARFVDQAELRGQAHALNLARAYLDAPVLIIFADTIVKADLTRLTDMTSDGVLYVKPVEDPRNFGVAKLQRGRISQIIEKPTRPVSNLALTGVYFIRDWRLLCDALEDVVTNQIHLGEVYLAEALQWMIDRGAQFEAWPVDAWEDCGTIPALLHTNRYLLTNGSARVPPSADHAIFVEPVRVDPSARIVNSIVGPYASVAAGAVITDSIVRDCIVGENATISQATLADSVIGTGSSVHGTFQRLNLGDVSRVDLGDATDNGAARHSCRGALG